MNTTASRWKIPHVFIFLFGIIVFCSILSYLIPSGSFERTSRTYGNITQNVVVPGSYEEIPKHITVRGFFLGDEAEGKASPISVIGVLTAIPKGLQQSAVLIFFVFMIGAMFSILQYTGSIDALLFFLINKFKDRPIWLFFMIYMLIFAGASFMGIVMETIALIPIFLFLAKKTGYDRMFGIGLVLIPCFIGWSTAVTNPFTVQIAQQIAELPIGSGIGLRLVLFIVSALTGFGLLMRYGNRVKKNPETSIMKDDPFTIAGTENFAGIPLTKKHIFILSLVVVSYALILFAVQVIGWSFIEMTGGFLGIAIMVTLISGISGDESMEACIKGLETMIIPALAVGVARGISVVLQEGMIIDTILYYASNSLSNLPTVLAGEGMLFFQSMLNFFIPSASGQALVSMPLMTPLADLLGISRQTAVLAYILGDGLSNLIIPTNGVLMAMLSLAGVPFEKWFRFILPIFIITMIIGMLFMMTAIVIGY